MAKKIQPKKKPVYVKKTVHINRVILDLKTLRGCFRHVNKDVAPNKDKGIYFEKAMQDLDHVIKKYEHLLELRK